MSTEVIEKLPKKLEETKTPKKSKNKKDATPRQPDATKYTGEGLMIKAKLIGLEDVDQARGDLMCQKTMKKLKDNVKMHGSHKQRILIYISLSGIKIVDEKSALPEHEHAVHRISFISRDITDTRAFGYVYGYPDGKHKFYAIKTEKASEHVVLALRDLFQVVYELKKKEMEAAKAKQNDEEEHHYENLEDAALAKSLGQGSTEHIYEVPKNNTPVKKSPTDDGKDDIRLLDLETELESIQQGIMQMDAFSDPFLALDTTADPGRTDPFGASPWLPTAPSPDPFVVNPNPLVSIKPPPIGNQSSPPGYVISSVGAQASFTDQDTSAAAGGATSNNPFADDPFFSSTPSRSGADKYSVLQELSVINVTSDATFLDSNSTMNDAFAASILDVPLTPLQQQTTLEDISVIEQNKEDDPFGELCPIGKKRSKKPKELFAEMQSPPPKKTLNQIRKETNPQHFDQDLFAVSSPEKNSNFTSDSSKSFASESTNPFSPLASKEAKGDVTSPSNVSSPSTASLGQGDCASLPSPDMPPPPLPSDVARSLPPAPAPPPRPRPVPAKAVSANPTSGASLPIIPPVGASPQRPKQSTQTIKIAVVDPFASDPFFATPIKQELNNNENKNQTEDPFAVFEKSATASPFIFNDLTQNENDVYATVTKPKRSS